MKELGTVFSAGLGGIPVGTVLSVYRNWAMSFCWLGSSAIWHRVVRLEELGTGLPAETCCALALSFLPGFLGTQRGFLAWSLVAKWEDIRIHNGRIRNGEGVWVSVIKHKAMTVLIFS